MNKVKISSFLSSPYAISLKEANKIVENLKTKDIPSGSDLVFDFSGIEIISSPFLRTFVNSFKEVNIRYENACEDIEKKWNQILNERKSNFNIEKVIKELGLDN